MPFIHRIGLKFAVVGALVALFSFVTALSIGSSNALRLFAVGEGLVVFAWWAHQRKMTASTLMPVPRLSVIERARLSSKTQAVLLHVEGERVLVVHSDTSTSVTRLRSVDALGDAS